MMAVESKSQRNTKKVQGRRTVRYESFDELLEEARDLANCEVQTLGNWTQGQIYRHLAESFDLSIDGADFLMPAPVRWFFRLTMMKKFMTKEIPAGFKTPATFVPEETTVEQGLELLEAAVIRLKQESNRAIHPGFGKITTKQWDEFNLRHAELHMSFLKPQM